VRTATRTTPTPSLCEDGVGTGRRPTARISSGDSASVTFDDDPGLRITAGATADR
jgi:hypothetical protein